MPTSVRDYVMVGARFSKLIVDEGSSLLRGDQHLSVEFLRSKPSLSAQRFGDRPVVELKVSVVATTAANDDAVLDKIFHVECTAGFVGLNERLDGDLESFAFCVDEFSRYVYWMLRERLDSVFSVTSLKGTHLPWDMTPQETKPRRQPGPPSAAKPKSLTSEPKGSSVLKSKSKRVPKKKTEARTKPQ